jgi:hypothetical protein
MVYGDFAAHPWQEDMFHRPDLIQAALAEQGFGFDIAMVTQKPTGRDELPTEVLVARNPVYNDQGKLTEAHFKAGTIAEHAVIIDHWVKNFQDEIVQPDGTRQRTAYGLGLPANRLWNHKNIQFFGNNKDAMSRILLENDAGPQTWPVISDEIPTNKPLIYKPQGGSLGNHVEIFRNRKELHDNSFRLAANGLVQVHKNVYAPIEGLIPDSKEDAKRLAYLESRDGANRPRELRTHVITATDEQGELQTAAHTIVKVGKPGRLSMEYDFSIGLDQSCVEGSDLLKTCSHLAQVVVREACTATEQITQSYGVFDALVDGHVQDSNATSIIDGNWRGPGLAVVARAARASFQDALVYSGRQNIARAT